MTAGTLLLTITLAQFSQDELAHRFVGELGPYRQFSAQSGVCQLPDGRTVTLVGLCDSKANTSPWNADGKAMSRDEATRFEGLLGYPLGKRPWPTGSEAKKGLGRAAVFEVAAASADGLQAFLEPPRELLVRAEATSLGKSSNRVARQFTVLFEATENSRTMNWSVLLLGPEIPIGPVTELGSRNLNGLSVSVQSKKAEPFSMYSRGRLTMMPITEYTLTVEAPAELEQQHLGIRSSDPPPLLKTGPSLVKEFVRALPSKRQGYKLFIFRAQGLDQADFEREFTIVTRSVTRVSFQAVPLLPAPAKLTGPGLELLH